MLGAHTVVVRVSRVHIDYIRAFSGIGRLKVFLNARAGRQTAQQREDETLAFTQFHEFAGFNRIRFMSAF